MGDPNFYYRKVLIFPDEEKFHRELGEIIVYGMGMAFLVLLLSRHFLVSLDLFCIFAGNY